jgi:hypothetical protein
MNPWAWGSTALTLWSTENDEWELPPTKVILTFKCTYFPSVPLGTACVSLERSQSIAMALGWGSEVKLYTIHVCYRRWRRLIASRLGGVNGLWLLHKLIGTDIGKCRGSRNVYY